MDDNIYWIWYVELKGITKSKKRKLLLKYGHPRVLHENAKGHYLDDDLSRALEIASLNEKYHIKTITPDDELHKKHMPDVVYYQGNPFRGYQSAVVGTRNMSNHGKLYTEIVCGQLVKKGICINSGLAKGVDVTAHKVATLADGNTQAFLAHGLEQCYPKEHAWHKDSILEKGAVFSSFPVGTPPRRHHFLIRNQLMAACSDEVIVIESPVKGGSLMTAEYARQYNKKLLVVQGTNSIHCAGNKKLIEAGAFQINIPQFEWCADERQYIEALRNSPMSTDKLKITFECSYDELNKSLLNLERRGWIKFKADGKWHYNGW